MGVGTQTFHPIWRNVALHHLLSNGCSAVNGCRQNERSKSISTIHTTPVHQITSGEAKSCIFSKKQIFHYDIFKLKPLLLTKIHTIHNIAFSREKGCLTSGDTYTHIKNFLQAKTVQTSFKRICGWILM